MPNTKTNLIKRDNVFISLNMHRNALIKSMRYHGLTATKVIKPIADALEAKKIVIHGKGDDAWSEEVIDHPTRLRAAQISIELLALIKEPEGSKEQDDNTGKMIKKALDSSDTVELQRVLFNKKDKTVTSDTKVVDNTSK